MAGAFAGKRVVVTGASGGLGRAVVRAFVEAGALCHVPERSTAARKPSAPNVHVVNGVDLTEERAVADFYASLPPVWASVHLAGGFAAGAFAETSLADLRRQLDLNLTTAFLCCREAVRNMRRQPGGGRLVNVLSRAALVPAAGMSAYSVSKGAVAALTRALAEELKSEAILVNAIAPSIINTPANRAAMPAADASRWPQPEQIAEAILWLASPANELTSGALVPVYGNA